MPLKKLESTFNVRTRHVHNLLADYENGKLDAALRRAVSDHLAECAECRTEAELFRSAFRTLQSVESPRLPASYFNTLVPRVRLRFEESKHLSWHRHWGLLRFAAPLAAAVVTVALLMQVPTPPNNRLEKNVPERNAVTSATIAEVITQQSGLPFLSSFEVQEFAASVLPDSLLQEQLTQRLLANGTDFGFDDFPSLSSEQFLNSFSEQELETLLHRLAERTLL